MCGQYYQVCIRAGLCFKVCRFCHLQKLRPFIFPHAVLHPIAVLLKSSGVVCANGQLQLFYRLTYTFIYVILCARTIVTTS